MHRKKIRLLFVCTANMQRSPTAATLFTHSDRYEARSAGVHPSAPHVVTQSNIDWADKIFVMSEREDRHLSSLKSRFDLTGKEVHDLDISDRYPYGSRELIDILHERLARHITLDD